MHLGSRQTQRVAPLFVDVICSDIGDICGFTQIVSGFYYLMLYLNVKTPRPQQRRIQIIAPVGGPEHDDALVLVEAIHLRQQLIDGLVGVGVQHTVGAFGAHRVYLVDEHNARGPLLGRLCKKLIAFSGCVKDIHKVRFRIVRGTVGSTFQHSASLY